VKVAITQRGFPDYKSNTAQQSVQWTCGIRRHFQAFFPGLSVHLYLRYTVLRTVQGWRRQDSLAQADKSD
jgi:hypothetical protein